MGNIFDRLSRGPAGTQQGGFDNWNEMVGSAPPERFGRAAYDAVRQVDPQDYYRHSQPGVDDSDPFGALQPRQRSGLLQSIFGELFRRGISRDEAMRGAGLRNIDPENMTSEEAAMLAQWLQREHPKAFGRVAAQYQDQPNVLESLLGNKALMMMLAGLGAKMMWDRSRR